MKKLLAVLGSLSIVSSSVTILGFEYANLVKSSIEAKIRNYINVSSLLARGTILSQVSQPSEGITTDGKGFSLAYASRYLYSKPMSTFFDQSQFQDQGQNVLSYLGQMFNLSSSAGVTYTVKDNPDFEVASPSIYLQSDVESGKKGEDSVLNVLAMIGSFAPVLLGNDFNAAITAPTLENLLGAGENLVKGLMEKGTFNNLQAMFFGLFEDNDQTKKTSFFDKLSTSLTEQDLIDKFGADQLTALSFNDVFQFRQIKFWQGLSEILYSGSRKEISDDDFVNWMNSIANATSNNYAEKAILTGSDAPKIQVEANKLLFDGITRVLPYIRTLLTYLQSFSVDALPISEINDNNHLFDQNISNGIYLAQKIKTELYLNPNKWVLTKNNQDLDIVQWVKNDDGSYHQVLNLQDMMQFLQSLFTVDLENDPQGYRLERILSIVLEIPLKSDDPVPSSRDEDAPNPIYDLLLEPLIKQLIKIFVSGIAGSLLPGLLPQYTPILRAILSHNHTFWSDSESTIYDVPGANQSVLNVVSALTKLKGLLGIINPKIKNFLNDLLIEIQKEQNDQPPVSERIYGRPFTSLFNGNLLSIIFNLLNDNEVITIDQKIFNIFKNIATIFTTKLGDVLGSLGLDLTTLPIFLYGIKDLSLTEIINSFADEFQTNLSKTLKDNQDFLFNLDALDRVVQALTMNVKVDMTGEIPAPIVDAGIDLNQEINLFNALLISFAYNSQITDLTTSQEKWTDNSLITKYGFLLGIRQAVGESAFAFAPNSLLYAIGQIYGQDNEIEPPVIQPKNKNTLITTLNGFADLVTWFNKTSVPLYLKEVFDPYFDSKLWKTTLIKSRNLDKLEKTATIDYFLDYQNPDLNYVTHRYEVRLSRSPATGNEEEWTEMGAWRITSINLKK